MSVFPADHVVTNSENFIKTLQQAEILAKKGYLVTIGIPPTRPETGFGYLQQGSEIENGAYNVEQFIEKPGQLIYSCGKSSKSKDSKGDKCGHQMTINLARYLHYSEMKEDVNKIMDGPMDLSLFDEIFSKEDIHKQHEIIKDNAKLFKKCKKPFSEQNQLKARVNVIKKTHKNRIQLKV